VRAVGVEPTNPVRTVALEATAFAIPPHPRIKTQKGSRQTAPLRLFWWPSNCDLQGHGYSVGEIASKDKERITNPSCVPFRDIREIAAMFRNVI
jgi:hypothetical protein